MEHRIILAIETSCDETSVAIIENGNKILSNKILTQIAIHQKFGGVVPEIASRHHVEAITIVLDEALSEANIKLSDIDAVCVTKGPGLVGSLLVGIQAAKAIALALEIPFIGVHHIAGHIYANQFVKEMQFPLLALVVSGGHTELVLMKEHMSFQVIGETYDDAVGEAYDKVARVLNLPYPGGPVIDQLAQVGKDTYNLPRVMMHEDNYDFSFSGLKSAVINVIHNAKQRNEEIINENVATSFQNCVVDILAHKTFKAAKEYNVKQIIVAGGVAANKGLRNRFEKEINALEGVDLVFPPMSLCTDNAAMIGAVGDRLYQLGKFDDFTLNGKPSMNLE